MRLIDLYHRLPGPLRTLAVSLKGYRLRRLRYGPDTDRIADEALALERLPPDEWRSRQAADLARTLRHAVEQVPYYRELWKERRRKGLDPTKLADWPILEKETLRARAAAFVADDVPPRRRYVDQTSGSTGTPLHPVWSHAAVRRHYALFEARWRRWYGVDRHDRWAILGGRLVVPISRRRPPYWVWNAGLNQLYLSAFHLTRATAPDYLEALRKHRVRYLFGYTSTLHNLAVECGAGAGKHLGLKVAITNAEPVTPLQRAAIAAAFDCPVRETYGMAELVASGSECEAGGMHLWPETGLMEVIEGETPVPAGEAGELICTGLINDAWPLIRYRIGDRGALADDSQPCPCGRTLPRLRSLDGRQEDALLTADGRRVCRFHGVFAANLPIREAQVVQERLDVFRIRVVPAAGYDETTAARLEQALRDRMGEVEVRVEPVQAIERSAAGKFRAVICNLPPEVKRRVAGYRGTVR